MKKSLYVAGILFILLTAAALGAVYYWNQQAADGVALYGSSLGIQSYDKPVPAEDFILSDPQGNTVRLADFRGKTVMLNFWATWCNPCRAEMPSMEVLHNRFKDKGLVVLAVASGEEREPVRAFVEEYHLTFPIVVDSEDKVTEAYRIWSIPMTYFINTRGEIVGRVQGNRSWDRNEAIQYVSHLLNT